MSLWGVHVGVAVLLTIPLLYVIRPAASYRWGATIVSGTWAIVPDLYWVFPVLRPFLKPRVHDTMLANLFWFHGWIDQADPADSPALSFLVGSLAVVAFLGLEYTCRRRG